MSKQKESKTPLLDDLEDGPWPSFVTDLKNLAKKKPAVGQLLVSLSSPMKSDGTTGLGL